MRPSDIEVSVRRGEELFGQGRWSDARQQFIKVREMLPLTERGLQIKVDYYLAMCAVELGQPDIEKRLRGYMDKYAGSVYHNDVRFALASYYCTRNEFGKARTEFADVDYRTLGHVQREKYDIRMGYIEFLDGNYDAAYNYFGKIGAASAYYDHAVYYKAYIEYIRGNYAAAKRMFSSLASSETYGEIVPYYLLQIEYREGNYSYVVNTGNTLLAKSSAAQRTDLLRIMAES